MVRNFLGLLGLVIIVIMFTGSCSMQESPIKYAAGQDGVGGDVLKAYRLGPGDEIKLSFYDEPSLSGEFGLDGRGVVDLPLVSEVKLGGLTSSEAVKEIRQKYSQGYLQDPKLTLKITEYRPFYILGEVRAPGRYSFEENLTVLEAVAMAEGFTYRANQDRLEIIRKIGSRQNTIVVGKHQKVMPGDIIKVKERFF